MNGRFRTTRRVLVPGLLLTSLLLGGSRLAPAMAEDATPAAMEDMGICTEALGIGNAGDACVNVVHASPDAPAVDVFVNGESALTNLAFGNSSGWVTLPAGEHQIQVSATGTPADQAVIDAMVTLEADMAYEVAATGLLAEITPQIYQTNLSSLAGDEEMARIRVIHASPDAPAVDVAVKGGDVLVPDLAFPDASDYLTVPATSYDLEVRPTGTTDVALDLPGVALEAETVYSVYAIGQAADGTLTVMLVTAEIGEDKM